MSRKMNYHHKQAKFTKYANSKSKSSSTPILTVSYPQTLNIHNTFSLHQKFTKTSPPFYSKPLKHHLNTETSNHQKTPAMPSASAQKHSKSKETGRKGSRLRHPATRRNSSPNSVAEGSHENMHGKKDNPIDLDDGNENGDGAPQPPHPGGSAAHQTNTPASPAPAASYSSTSSPSPTTAIKSSVPLNAKSSATPATSPGPTTG